MLKAGDDPDPRVRMELALALGSCDEPKAGEALARILAQGSLRALDPRGRVRQPAANHVKSLLLALQGGEGEPPLAIVQPLVELAGSTADHS